MEGMRPYATSGSGHGQPRPLRWSPMSRARRLALWPLLPLLPLLPLQAQTGAIAGTVADSTAHVPLAGAVLQAGQGGAVVARAISGNDGAFRLERLPAGVYVVTVSRIGYGSAVLDQVAVREGATTTLRVALVARALELNPEVVTASRHEEKALDAPASVSVIGTQDIREQPSLTPAERKEALAKSDTATRDLAAKNAWLRFFLEYDPLPTARKVRVPVLVLQGATDQQVTPEQADTLAAALKAGGDRDVTARKFPATNHLFLADPDGSPTGYAALPVHSVRREVLGAIADWLVAHLR